jgi:hypothetical protein
MRGFMTICLVAGLLLVGNAMLENTAQPTVAEAPTLPVPVVEIPSVDKTCCDDECNCCEQCPCNSVLEPVVESVAEVPKQNPAAYAVGDEIRTSSGALHTVTKVSVIDGKWAYHTKPKSVSVSVSTPAASVSGYYDGTSQWTYPGDIRSHLATSHGTTAAAGMSKDQMESLHDSLHNATRYAPAPRQFVMPRVQSNCPGGVCPTQPRTTLFSRWR